MKIPEKVKVGAMIYEVVFSEDVTYEGDAYGCTHHSHEKIFISPGYSDQRKEVTFLHELLHACLEVAGLNHRFGNKTYETLPTAEDVVRDSAMILYQVIKDNSDIFK